MTERAFHDALVLAWFPLSVLVFLAVTFIRAPYGRHARSGWGPQIGNRWGWVVMELPAVVTMPLCFFFGDQRTAAAIIALIVWELHYVNRTFVFPFRLRTSGKKMPLLVALLGAVTNVGIGYSVGRGIFHFSPTSLGVQTAVGALIFAAGFAINNHSDHVLLNLRAPGETGYRIPTGGVFRFVSCPNYLGEVVEWIGFAVMTWSVPALAFVCWTAANLVPRARAHHAWYREKFSDYPTHRKALLPFLL